MIDTLTLITKIKKICKNFPLKNVNLSITPIRSGVIKSVILSSKKCETFSIFFKSIILKCSNKTKRIIEIIVAGSFDFKRISKIEPKIKKNKITKNS